MGSNHLLVSASLDSALSGHASLGTPGSADCLTSEIYIGFPCVTRCPLEGIGILL